MTDFVNQYSCSDCKHCYTSNPFNLLGKEELDILDKTRMEVQFKKGEIIYKQGTPLTHVVIIHDGLGKIYIEGSNNRNLTLCYTKKYELNGGVGIFVDQRHHSSLMAVTDCKSCFIDIQAFKAVMYGNAAFMEAYLKEYSERVLHSYNQMVVLTQKNMEGRMAEAILDLNDNIFENEVITNISKQDLSEFTAMTKESAIRVLRDFSEEGQIEISNQTIRVLDRESLEHIAQYG
ncbi:MAG: Crp/Fnr family transcriptional regulator [Cyclobacteriaceae bacterium]